MDTEKNDSWSKLDPKMEQSAKQLLVQAPDLHIFTHPYTRSTSFASKRGISGTEQVEYNTRTEGNSQVLEAWIYSMIDGHRVYSLPQYFDLGRSIDQGFGYEINQSVLDTLDRLGVKFSVRKDIALYMASKSAIPY